MRELASDLRATFLAFQQAWRRSAQEAHEMFDPNNGSSVTQQVAAVATGWIDLNVSFWGSITSDDRLYALLSEHKRNKGWGFDVVLFYFLLCITFHVITGKGNGKKKLLNGVWNIWQQFGIIIAGSDG